MQHCNTLYHERINILVQDKKCVVVWVVQNDYYSRESKQQMKNIPYSPEHQMVIFFPVSLSEKWKFTL